MHIFFYGKKNSKVQQISENKFFLTEIREYDRNDLSGYKIEKITKDSI